MKHSRKSTLCLNLEADTSNEQGSFPIEEIKPGLLEKVREMDLGRMGRAP
jgi:hypothetical protein